MAQDPFALYAPGSGPEARSPGGLILPQPAIPQPSVWLDENFLGNSLNTAIWRPTFSNGGQTQFSTGQVQYYIPSQIVVGGGECQLIARLAVMADNVPNGCYWVSGIINTYKSFLYGSVRVKAKWPAGNNGPLTWWPGAWPGICMFNDNIYPPEFDLLEINGNPLNANMRMTCHYAPGNLQQTKSGVTWDQSQWNVFGMDWSPGKAIWSINETPYMTMLNDRVSSVPMNLTIMMQIGGPSGWGGGYDGTTPSPFVMELDYVHVTQQS